MVRDRDGVETLVPNQNLITNSVINWSYSDPRVRLRLPVMISYKDDPEIALKALLEAAANHPRILREPRPVSRLMSFEDYGMRSRCASGSPIPGRRQQRAFGRESRDLAPVQEARHHDSGAQRDVP